MSCPNLKLAGLCSLRVRDGVLMHPSHPDALPVVRRLPQRGALPLTAFETAAITSKTRNTKNRIFAIPAAAPAIPVKPSRPAMSAMMRNVMVQDNIVDVVERFCFEWTTYLADIAPKVCGNGAALSQVRVPARFLWWELLLALVVCDADCTEYLQDALLASQIRSLGVVSTEPSRCLPTGTG